MHVGTICCTAPKNKNVTTHQGYGGYRNATCRSQQLWLVSLGCFYFSLQSLTPVEINENEDNSWKKLLFCTARLAKTSGNLITMITALYHSQQKNVNMTKAPDSIMEPGEPSHCRSISQSEQSRDIKHKIHSSNVMVLLSAGDESNLLL